MATQALEKTSDILLPGAPRIGFGCGDLFAGATEAASARLIETALDAGIRYFDVARLYGNGTAEDVLGRAVSRARGQVIIASKAGILPWSMLLWRRLALNAANAVRSALPAAQTFVRKPPPPSARYGAFRLRDVERSLHQSLKALRTDYLDILLLHECTVADAGRPEIQGLLEKLRSEGKIRAFGIATHFDVTVQILRDYPGVAPVVQFPSDALSCNVARLPASQLGLVVTHSPIKHVLPRLMQHLAADPAAGVRWERGTGIASVDRAGTAGLLLAEAVTQNAAGMVLFSSSQPEHIRGTLSAVAASSGPQLAALREELAHIR